MIRCSSCGARKDSNKVPQNPDPWSWCPWCGYRLLPAADCPGCGREME
jgi:hypothetical protein